jgi:Tol biopolymer transport system component
MGKDILAADLRTTQNKILWRMNMKMKLVVIVGITLLILAGALTACSAREDAVAQEGASGIANPTATTLPAVEQPNQAPEINLQPTATQETYSDPFAYCAAVGTIDTPDARYTGPKISPEIINGFKAAAGLQESPMPEDMFEKTTIWRCMDNQVYACNFGANLPCNSKANTEKTPSQAMNDYCLANPDAEYIPMSVTGHSTIYSWHCVADTAELLDQIENVDAAGYLAQIWYAITPGASEVTETVPTTLGGSRGILFSSNRGGYYDDLYVLDFTSKQVTRLTSGDSNTFPGPFSPDGTKLLFTGFGLTNSYIGVMNADGTNPVDLSARPDVDEGFPCWSPDGTQIAFTSRMSGNNDIYTMDANGGNVRQITTNPTDDFAPAWSPDGGQIAFVSDRNNPSGVNNLYLMNVDGSNVMRLTSGDEIDYGPAWSPDGSRIAFRADVDGNSDIYVINADGSGRVNLTNDPSSDRSPAWSPDGSLIAFQTDREGNWEIYVMNADGSHLQNLTQDNADDQMPYWKPATTQLANPASANCIQQGGFIEMEDRAGLGEFGVCYFLDNRQCEEWALLRGDCPVGGLKVTGYLNEAARYCAITGGEYTITGNSEDPNQQQGTCTFNTGKTCNASDYYDGTCNPNN